MTISITPVADIDLKQNDFTGKDGKAVLMFMGRGVINVTDPVAVRVTSRRACKLVAGKSVVVTLREYTSKGEIPVAKVSLA